MSQFVPSFAHLARCRRVAARMACTALGVTALGVTILGVGLLGVTAAQTLAEQPADPANPVVAVQTSKGTFTIELFREQAPRSVENFLRYVDEGFYDETIFHRVIDGVLIQGGGYTLDGDEKPGHPPIRLESSQRRKNLRGTVGMARNDATGSARAQFYVNLRDNPGFDRTGTRFGYAVFGRVIEGMNVVERISRVQTSRRGTLSDIPILPVYVKSVRRLAALGP